MTEHGHRPSLPETTPVAIANILQRCWQHNHALRPPASEVSAKLEHYMECKSVEASMEGTQASSLMSQKLFQ